MPRARRTTTSTGIRSGPKGSGADGSRLLAQGRSREGLDGVAPADIHWWRRETMTVSRDDERLVGQLRRGEDGAVEALVDRYAGWIHRLARRLLGDPRDAEEVTQDVLLTVVRKIQTFKGDA